MTLRRQSEPAGKVGSQRWFCCFELWSCQEGNYEKHLELKLLQVASLQLLHTMCAPCSAGEGPAASVIVNESHRSFNVKKLALLKIQMSRRPIPGSKMPLAKSRSLSQAISSEFCFGRGVLFCQPAFLSCISFAIMGDIPTLFHQISLD